MTYSSNNLLLYCNKGPSALLGCYNGKQGFGMGCPGNVTRMMRWMCTVPRRWNSAKDRWEVSQVGEGNQTVGRGAETPTTDDKKEQGIQ